MYNLTRYIFKKIRINGDVMDTKNKVKLNLTINKNLVPKAKLYASKNGKSVSQLVEELLTQVLESKTIGFTNKWLGKLSVNEEQDTRINNLKRRYGF